MRRISSGRVMRVVMAAVLAGILAGWCEGAIIQIGFSGVVYQVIDDYGLLEGGVQVGNGISGYYIYDSETLDSEPAGTIGLYEHSSAPFGMLVEAGSLIFQSDPANVDFTISLYDNHFPHWDTYNVHSSNNLELDNGVPVDGIDWQLDNYYGTAISSNTLESNPPNLSRWDVNSIAVGGAIYPVGGGKKTYTVLGQIESAWVIPEPTALLLLSAGGLVLKRRARIGRVKNSASVR